MSEFKCGICETTNNSGGFMTSQYESWIYHLLSNDHQNEVKKKQNEMKKWRDEKDSFVLKGTYTNGFPWKIAELAEWLSSYGVLTQLLYNETYYFCIFTLQGFGKIGRERILSITNQTEFQGHAFSIKPKNSYGPNEWNSIYHTVDSQRCSETSVAAQGVASAAVTAKTIAKCSSKTQVPDTSHVSSSTSIHKETRIFTNKKHGYGQRNAVGANNGNNNSFNTLLSTEENQNNERKPHNQGAVPVGDEFSRKKKRQRFKEKKQQSRDDKDNPNVNIKEASSRSSTCSVSSSCVDAPSSSQVMENSDLKDVKENVQMTPKNTIQQPEPFNFRGGFTPSGRKREDFKVSIGDTINVPVDESGKETPTPQCAKPPEIKILQRTEQRVRNQTQKQTETRVLQNSSSKNPHGTGTRSTAGFPPLPYHHKSRPQAHQTQRAPHYAQGILLSPTFVGQINPSIAASLTNPSTPTSRNPYKFDNFAPFPHFFELFQKLPEESFKPQKEILFRQFQALSLPEQLEEFFAASTITFDETRLRWQVLLDILYILRQHFPRCELYAFGSIITNLNDFTSDIDIYVDLEGHTNSSQPIDHSQKMSAHQAVVLLKKIFWKSICPHSKTRFVKTIIPVTSARVPILKLTHQSTKINCDLSFENRLSLQNTKMLALYLNFDMRIYRFMVLIRYWAKFHHLTGSNHIKNYALTLLVLVYLTRNNYVPPIELLQRLKAKERKKKRIQTNPDEIDGWDASFCDDVSVIKENFKANNLPFLDNNNTGYKSQSHTLVQLAMDFFEMYANLDFSKIVVCPLLGDFIPKQNFLPGSEETLPDSLDRYKNWAAKQTMNRRININSQLCVQDPFLLSFNVGSVTPQGTLLRFQLACAKSLQALQNNGLKSLLDVLIRLPIHIGEKKFMKTYRTEMKALELKKEIKKFVLETAVVEKDENEVYAPSSQVSSYVKLPLHLRSFDKLIDERGLKQNAKRPRWELFLDFSLTSLFEDILVTELTLCQIRNYKRTDLVDILCTLWYQFTLDFLSDIFDTGLKLTVVKKTEESSEPYYALDSNTSQDGENGVAEEEEKRKRWKVKMLSKQDEEKLLHQTKHFSPKTPEDVNKLKEKISALPKMKRIIQYKLLQYKVTYPFWDKRPSLLDKVAKEMKPCEMVRIRAVPTSRNKLKKNKNNKARKDDGKDNELFAGDATKGYIDGFNPATLEANVSKVVLDKFKAKEEKTNFTELQINVLVKVDMTSVTDRPELYFVFENDLPTKKNSDDYFRAVQCLANIVTEGFPRYQIYRLARWLDLPSPNNEDLAAGKVETKLAEAEKRTDEIDVVSSQVAPKGGPLVMQKKKSTRTKLEEDLLIPSSSSSTCSDDEENDELEEDKSNDDNGDEDAAAASPGDGTMQNSS